MRRRTDILAHSVYDVIFFIASGLETSCLQRIKNKYGRKCIIHAMTSTEKRGAQFNIISIRGM